MLRKIERYEVEEEIGHGGMATVYRALDTKLDRKVALKVMHPHLRGAKEARARFRREAQSVARLAHPRILEIYDYSGEGSEESYIASKLLTGPTLRRWAEENAPVPAEVAACIGLEICAALQAAHEKKIIHRDVKPENILLHENRELVLTDFGIADMVDSQSMTATGQILGSPGHMAPEQIEGGQTDARTDVFALGTVLYYLSTGRLPFSGKNPHQILKRIADGEYADPLRVAPRVGGRFAAILRKALERAPEDRYASADALAEELRAFVAEVGIDDSHAALAKYLAAPAEETAALVPKILSINITKGKEARDAGRFPEASDRFGRVLAMDEGNAEVLALVRRMQQEAKRPSMGAVAAGVAALCAVVIGGWLALTGPGPSTATPDAGVLALVADLDAAPAEPDAPTLAVEANDAGLDAGTAGDGRRDAPRGRVVPSVPSAPRVVRFLTTPGGVQVRIDGGPQTSPRDVELTIGPHDVSISPNDPERSAYQSDDFVLNVVPGDGVMEVTRTLRFRVAGLMVNGVRGGMVTIGNEHASTRSVISVPMTQRETTMSFRVTAPGYLEYTGEVTLVAGAPVQTVTIRMEPDPAVAPDPETPPGAP